MAQVFSNVGEVDEVFARFRAGVTLRNRRYWNRVYPSCFVGHEAIGWLKSELGISTEEAIDMGNTMMEMGYIRHVTNEHGLENKNLFYQVTDSGNKVLKMNDSFEASSPTAIAQFRKPMHETDIGELSKLMKSRVDVQDRRYLGKEYDDCFVGSEAVAWLREVTQLSTAEVVVIGNRMMMGGVFTHVLGQHPFRNGNLFYRFTDSDVPGGGSLSPWDLSFRADDDEKSELSSAATEDTPVPSCTLAPEEIERLLNHLRATVQVRDRWYWNKKFENCFLGTDAVKVLQDASHRPVSEVVAIGNRMVEQGAFRHVTNQHNFENRKLFYEFVSDAEEAMSGKQVASPGSPGKLTTPSPRWETEATHSEWSTEEVVELFGRFKESGNIRDRTFHGRTYRDCFVGSEAVKWLCDATGLEIDGALLLGNEMVAMTMIHHVHHQHAFKNEKLFYRFWDDG